MCAVCVINISVFSVVPVLFDYRIIELGFTLLYSMNYCHLWAVMSLGCVLSDDFREDRIRVRYIFCSFSLSTDAHRTNDAIKILFFVHLGTKKLAIRFYCQLNCAQSWS